jgi:hypothetical protein
MLCLFALETPIYAGISSDKAMYVGGTVSALSEKTEGRISTSDAKQFVFEAKSTKLAIPYDHILTMEYGQKAGRRVGMAVAVSPVLLFSKKRKHYLTLGFTDDASKNQAAVFEIGKDLVRNLLAQLESKTGKKIDYQDDEARKSAGSK